MPDPWDPNNEEPATKHLLMAVIEIDQVIKDHNIRLEEIEVRLGLCSRPPNPHADEIRYDF